MHSKKLGSRGFTLVVSLMLLLIMSGVAIGLLMMVNTEGRVGGQDTQNSLAFHAAEGGIEHMTSDLAGMYQSFLSPNAAQIMNLSADAPPATAFISYPVYTLTPATNADGTLASSYGQVATGPFQGLYAQITPVTLQVTATTSIAGLGTAGDEVNMSRQVEIALVPVFQFGVFSESDLSFFAGVPLIFAGRVHTNGDLYLDAGTGNTTTFEDKVSAWGNVIRTQMANGTPSTVNHLGTIDVLTTSQGCPGVQPACWALGQAEGSVVGGPSSGQNPLWKGISGRYNGWLIDGNYGLAGGTGGTQISLPFINNTPGAGAQPQPYEIIRRPPAGEVATSPLGASRLYNEAEIRVLLSDSPAELPGGAGDPQNIRLANVNSVVGGGMQYLYGVSASTVAGLGGLASGGSYNTYFATASTGVPDPTNWTALLPKLPADSLFAPIPPQAGDVYLADPLAPVMHQGNDGFANAPALITLSTCSTVTGSCVPAPAYPYYSPLAYPLPTVQMSTWNLLDGYLRVEYIDAAGTPHAVTQEWLQLGFARDALPPNIAAVPAYPNDINPNAILIFQKPADRGGNGSVDAVGIPPGPCTKVGGVWKCPSGKPPEVTKDILTSDYRYGDSKHGGGASPTQYNWYPIDFYDAREGETRAVNTGDTSCTPAGVMNAVELDVANLRKWLKGTIAGSGTLVNSTFENGYVLYFSDRRGMLPSPTGTPPVDPAGTKTGDSGLEDAINSGTQLGAPDGALEPKPGNKQQSPEDVNNNGALDNYGARNLGLGLGAIPVTSYGGANGGPNSVNTLIRKAAGAFDPYLTAGRMPSCSEKNWVSGARHVLRLVDGSLGNVPTMPAPINGSMGGFTVASENPVYILGDYNSSAADPTWLNPLAAEPAHAAAGVIADAVTMQSNNWSDLGSLNSPSNDVGRPALTTYYRVAISGGKNINFPVNVCCAWSTDDWGTDGGLHNFLRLLEDWSASGGQALWYKGSMVSMYYATYATGVDKNGSGVIYNPPIRNYFFDPLFTKPQNLPPGTPLFRDIDNLSYRQSFTPHNGAF